MKFNDLGINYSIIEAKDTRGSTSKPSDFKSLYKNGQQAWGDRTSDETKAETLPAFRFVLKKDKNVKSSVVLFKKNLDRETQVEIALETTVDDFKESDPQKYAKLKESDFKVEYLDSSDEESTLNDKNELNTTDIPTYTQQLKDYTNAKTVKQLQSQGAITVYSALETIKRDAESTPQMKKKLPYYETFVGYMISNKEKGFDRPITIISDTSKIKSMGFKSMSECITEFTEVAGAIGLVSGSVNGNAARVLKQLFTVNGVVPTTNELMKNATIHFHPSSSHQLVDSYIEYKGTVLRVSSKAGAGISGGMGASLDGLFESLKEVSANPEARSRFNKLLASDREYVTAFETIKALSKTDSTGIEGFFAKCRILNMVVGTNSNLGVTGEDEQILSTILKASGRKELNAGMIDAKHLLGVAFGSIPDIDDTTVNVLGNARFSDKFKNIMRYYERNGHGESGMSGHATITSIDDLENEKSKSHHSKKGWWLAVQRAIYWTLSDTLNKNGKFSDLMVFILNHGNFCQIDTRHKEVKNGTKKSQVIYNMTATWPATAVDKVELMLSVERSIQYSLKINGDNEYDDRKQFKYNDTDFNFGFKSKAELAKTMKPTQRDMSHNDNTWLDQDVTSTRSVNGSSVYQLQRSTARTAQQKKSTRNRDLVTDYFKALNNANIIQTIPATVPQQLQSIDSVISNVLSGKVRGQQLTFLIERTRADINATRFQQYYRAKPDEKVFEQDVQLIKNTSIEAQRYALLIKSMLYPVYYSIAIDDALARYPDKKALSNDPTFTSNIERLKQAITGVNAQLLQPNLSRYLQIIQRRLQA